MSSISRTLMRFKSLLGICRRHNINSRWTRQYGSFSIPELQRMVTDLLSRYIDNEINFTALKLLPGQIENGYKDWDVIEQDTKFSLSEVFSRGFEEMIKFEESGTATEEFNSALTSLASFLSQKDYHGEILKSSAQQPFEHRRAILANHLLSQLLESREYSIPYGGVNLETCPCSDSTCKLPVSYIWLNDDTGLSGIDITLYHENLTTCPSLVPKQQEEASQYVSPLRNMKFQQRCYQQTVKYTYSSHKIHFQENERMKFFSSVKKQVPLFQVIALDEQMFDAYAYHPMNDVFLRTSQPVSLWGKEGLDKISIMQLWFIIHYDLFIANVNVSNEELNHSVKFGLHAFVGKKELANYAHHIELTENPFILGNIPRKFE